MYFTIGAASWVVIVGELKALLSDGLVEASIPTRLCRVMSEYSEAERELAAELAEIKVRLEEEGMELRNSKAEVETLKLELEHVKMSTELESLRTVKHLRIQHEEVVTHVRGIASEERRRMEEWMMKSEESWRRETELWVNNTTVHSDNRKNIY